MIPFVSRPLCVLISENDQCDCVPPQIGTLLNLVQEFGNRRPLICGAGGQRCPSLLCLFVCSQIDACVSAALYLFRHCRTERAGTKPAWISVILPMICVWSTSRCRLMSLCVVQRVRGLYIPEASLCRGDLHRMEMEQPVEAGHSRIGPFELLWADLCFLCWTCWPPWEIHAQTHTLFTKACSAWWPSPVRHPTSWLSVHFCVPLCHLRFHLKHAG